MGALTASTLNECLHSNATCSACACSYLWPLRLKCSHLADREAEAAKLFRRAAELEKHAQELAAAEQQPASASLAAAPAAPLSSGMAETAASGVSGISKGQLKSRNRSSAATTARPAAALHGQVVWALVKGWPLWPAVVLTEEQMDDVLIPAATGRLNKGDCTKDNSENSHLCFSTCPASLSAVRCWPDDPTLGFATRLSLGFSVITGAPLHTSQAHVGSCPAWHIIVCYFLCKHPDTKHLAVPVTFFCTLMLLACISPRAPVRSCRDVV